MKKCVWGQWHRVRQEDGFCLYCMAFTGWTDNMGCFDLGLRLAAKLDSGIYNLKQRLRLIAPCRACNSNGWFGFFFKGNVAIRCRFCGYENLLKNHDLSFGIEKIKF